ncbi:sulfotransferase [Aureococcus anophagefferens]|nr:sulfotransferase [Aureococcus anophagefferens]
MPSAIELRVGSVDAAARAFALGYDTVCLDDRGLRRHRRRREPQGALRPAARGRRGRALGVAFEVSCGRRLRPRTLRHLAATAARLDAAAGGARGALAFSSGAAAAWQRRLAEDHQCASVAFAPHTIVDTADNAASVFAVDVDGDGDLDVLSASSSDDTVAWYDDDGAVSFTTRIVSRLVNYARSVYATDVDGDGDVDVVAVAYSDDAVFLFENDGAQSFRNHTVDDAADGPLNCYATDVDGDGAADVLAASRNDDTVAWYANDGALTFAKAVISATPDQAAAVFAIDVDGDGDVDALSASRNDNTVAWYENDGAQSFSKRIITFAAGYANAVVALDVDGDGDVDASWTTLKVDVEASGAFAVYAIDLDGDGDVDVVAASALDDTVAWHENDGAQSFTKRVITTLTDAGSYQFAVHAADLDDEGDVDVLSASGDDDAVRWFENDCPTFAPTASPAPSTPPTPEPSGAPTSAPTHDDCPAGTFSDDLRGPGCAACPSGRFQNATGQTSCDVCAVNTYAAGGATSCAACDPGKQSGLGSAECSWCSTGQYQTLGDDDEKVCVDCANGTYSPVGLTCLDCGPGLYSDDRVNCVYCATGTYSDGSRNSGCETCPAGAFAVSGSTECLDCPAGRYQDAPGSEWCTSAPPGSYAPEDGASEATPCPPGSFSGSGATACEPCGASEYANHSGMTACYLCPAPLTASGSGGATYCDACEAGFYWDTPYWDTTGAAALRASYDPDDPDAFAGAQCSDCCVECPDDGARCYAAGVTLETLPLKRDYWRASLYTDELYECAVTDACKGGSGNDTDRGESSERYCRRGHEDVLCAVCAEDYMFDTVKGRCVECASPAWDISVSPGRLVSLCLFLFLFMAVVTWYVRKRGCSARSLMELRQVSKTTSRHKQQAFEDDDDGTGAFITKYLTKIKILIGLYQIIGSTQWTLPQVPFPDILDAPFNVSRFFVLDVMSALPLDCFRRVNFFESLVFTTLAPFALSALAMAWFFKREYFGDDADVRHAATSSKNYCLLFISFCVLPACASKVFQYFGCMSYDLGDWAPRGDGWARQRDDLRILVADPTVDCDGARYGHWLVYVLLMVAIYPLGTPLFYFFILWSKRKDLNPKFEDLNATEKQHSGLRGSMKAREAHPFNDFYDDDHEVRATPPPSDDDDGEEPAEPAPDEPAEPAADEPAELAADDLSAGSDEPRRGSTRRAS